MPDAAKSMKSAPAKCGACNRPMNNPLFCGNCATLHPVDGFNHFELLGFAPTYEIDAAALRRKYLECSRVIHPDRHGTAGVETVTLSVRGSARLNEAFRVLGDPVLRAEYLLELLGGKSSAEDKSVAQGVLTHTLLLRGEMEDAREAGDAARLADCQAQARALYYEAVSGVAELARQLPGSDEIRAALRQKLNAVKYFQKLLDQP